MVAINPTDNPRFQHACLCHWHHPCHLQLLLAGQAGSEVIDQAREATDHYAVHSNGMLPLGRISRLLHHLHHTEEPRDAGTNLPSFLHIQ